MKVNLKHHNTLTKNRVVSQWIKPLLHIIASLRYIILFIFLSALFSGKVISQPRYFPPGTQEIYISDNPNVRPDLLTQIAPLIERSIREGYYPGAVILAGCGDQTIYQGVFGNRRILPDIAPMKLDTIFDLASLTKVVATTPAVMQLIDQGRIDLDDPVAKYWPEFAAYNKENITIGELLTHTSGLPADIPSALLNQLLVQANKPSAVMPIDHVWQGEEGAMQETQALKLIHPPGTTFLYSDVDFLILGYLVERITGEHLDDYAAEHIFKPLRMDHTFFSPPPKWKDQIAPTQIIDGKLHWGEVHDPTAYQMGGVAGFAGVFSTAQDLSLYIRCLLNGGRLPDTEDIHKKNNYLLGPLTVLKMTTPQTPLDMKDVRGLGWDINSSFSNRGSLFSAASYGHTGWTGTSMWIDPVTKVWVIILTSRTHPTPAKNNILVSERRIIANIIAGSIVNTPDLVLNRKKDEVQHAERFSFGGAIPLGSLFNPALWVCL